MSLIWFHRLLITTAIIFCVFFSAWEVVAYVRTNSPWVLVFAAGFFVAAVALGVYLWNLKKVLGYEPNK